MKAVCLYAFVLLFLTPVAAAWADGASALPPEQHAGSIAYRTGGIGRPEADAMKAARSSYALSLTFATMEDGHAAYEADVPVKIANAKGQQVFQATSDGPFMLIDLPPGAYQVTATAHRRPMTRKVTVTAGKPRRLVFEWRASPNQ